MANEKNQYDEFVKDYLKDEIKDYTIEQLFDAAQNYLIDKGFGADQTKAAVLFITNGGRGVDFSDYLDVEPQSKLAAKLASLDVAKVYSVLSTIATYAGILQGLRLNLDDINDYRDESGKFNSEGKKKLEGALYNFIDLSTELLDFVPGGFIYSIPLSALKSEIGKAIKLGEKWNDRAPAIDFIIEYDLESVQGWKELYEGDYENGPSIEEMEAAFEEAGYVPDVFNDYIEWRIKFEFEEKLREQYIDPDYYYRKMEELTPKWYENLWNKLKNGASDKIEDIVEGIKDLGDFWGDAGAELYDKLHVIEDSKGLIIDFVNTLKENRARKEEESRLNGLSALPTDETDHIIGSEKKDEIHALDGDDHIHGLGGNDIIYGDEGDDWLFGYDGEDRLWGGTGNDLLKGGNDYDHIFGEEGNDEIHGQDEFDILCGGDGNDIIDGGEDGDRIIGGNDMDIVFGGNGNDTIYGDFREVENTQGVEDYLFGGAGNDYIYGGAGNDIINGDGYTSEDVVLPISQAGNDDIEGNAGNDVIKGGYGDDKLDGGTGTDFLFGEGGNDELYGGDGSDYLEGGIDDDKLYGGEGNDLLNGGHDNDKLYGNAGNDTYVFNKYFGNDFLFDIRGNSTVYFEERSRADFSFERIDDSSNSIKLKTNNSGNSLIIAHYFEHKDQFVFKFENDGETAYKLKENDDGSLAFEQLPKHSSNNWHGSFGGDSSGGSILDNLRNESFGKNATDYGTATKVQPPRDPLVINFSKEDDFAYLDVNDAKNNAYFDLDKNDFAEKTAWIDESCGFLAIDLNGNGIIDNGGELFSNYYVKKNGELAKSGFDALQDLDNGDNVINKDDECFDDLYIWVDKGNDGKSEGELYKLEDKDIVSISLERTSLEESKKNTSDVIVTEKSVVELKDGSTRDIAEHWFKVNSSDTQEINPSGIDNDFTSFGSMHSLSYALEKDETGLLKNMVEAFRCSNDYIEKRVITRNILYYITGATNIDENARGGSVDARNLHVIETIMGVDKFEGVDGKSTPNSNAASILNRIYMDFEELYFTLLNDGSYSADYIGLINEKYDEDNESIVLDLSMIFKKIDKHIASGNNMDSVIVDVSAFVNSYDKVFGTDYLSSVKEHYSDKSYIINQMLTSTFIIGTDVNDEISATNSDETIWSDSGDDIINAGGGNDFIYSGIGNDALKGGRGSDTYIFNLGDGIDVINETNSNSASDTIQFGEGITADDITVSRSDGDMIITIGTDGDSIRIVKQYNDSWYRIEKIVFTDGLVKEVLYSDFDNISAIADAAREEAMLSANVDILSDICNADDSVVETDLSNLDMMDSNIAVLNDNEHEEIYDQTDIQLMVLTENMSAFADEANVYDTANITDTTTDTALNQLLVNSAV